jgi:AAA domain/Bacterial regulatory protein, arsR family/Primase C terminal 2 (PriCT-2)
MNAVTPKSQTPAAAAEYVKAGNGQAPPRVIDCAQAARHIGRLTGARNGQYVDVTFQTFDDNKTPGHKPDKSLARTIHGCLDECVAELNDFHARGAGVFITVNLTKGKRRRNDDVIEGRAVFIEDDAGAYLNPDIAPHLKIQSSPNKEHRYFLTRTSDLARWRRVQESLVQDFGSDPNAKDPARVLRLAGSWHLKDPAQPHRVRILECNDAPPYSWDDIEKAVPWVAPPDDPDDGVETSISDATIMLSENQIRDLRSALPFVDADTREKWVKIGHALNCLGSVGFNLYEQYSRYSSKFYDVADFRAQWDGYHPQRIDYRAIFTEAQNRGWVNPLSKRDPPTTIFQPNLRTAGAILKMSIPAMVWIVTGLIVQGVTLLVASPKIGKSWLALQVALATAAGATVLGRATTLGKVLYLALEDGNRRLQDRLMKLGADGLSAAALANIQFETAWPRINQGGAEHIEAWLKATPDARLVVVDVLQKIRPPRNAKANGYDEDYEALRQLKALADKYGVAILVVHHTRKSTADDIVETVSGTQGLTGAADALLIIKRPRGEERGQLHVTGRDLPVEGEYVVNFSKASCQWTMVGDKDLIAPTEARTAILDLLADGVAMRMSELALETGKSPANVSKLLRKMRAAGQVMQVGRGLYALSTLVTSVASDLSVTPVT